MAPQNNEPLRAYLNVQTRSDAELRRIFTKAANDARRQIQRLPRGVGGQVRKAQLERVLKEIEQQQMNLWTTEVFGVIIAGRSAAIEAAQDVSDALVRVLYVALPERVAEAVSAGLRAAARSGIESEKARVPKQLSQRVYRAGVNTMAEIDDTIRSGLIRSVSAKQLATEVHQFVSPSTPGGASYAAMRLARTEINNAFHERQKTNGRRPGVRGTKWNLSGSHKTPDDCNKYAETVHVRGWPKGVFKVDSVPDKPHPQCLCYMTYDMVTPQQFRAALLAGDFDAELDRRVQEKLRRVA